jgi:putative nucleotidyltransferase with HDIG domain
MNEAQPGEFSDLGTGPVGKRLQAMRGRLRHLGLVDGLASFALAAALVLMMSPGFGQRATPQLREGEIARETVRAPRGLEVEDPDATAAEKARLLDKIPDVYDYDPGAVAAWTEKWKYAIRQARVARRMGAVSAALGFEITREEYLALAALRFSSDLERSASFTFAPLWDRKIAQGGSASLGLRPLEVVDIKSTQSKVIKRLDELNVLAVEDAARLVQQSYREVRGSHLGNLRVPWTQWPDKLTEQVVGVQARLVAANLSLNRKETEARKADALKGLRPSFQKLERGEVIVREGDRVGTREAQVLHSLHAMGSANVESRSRWAQILFGAFSLWIGIFVLRRQFPQLLANHKDSLVTAAFTVTSWACFKLTLMFAIGVISRSVAGVPDAFFLFLIPVAVPAMTLRLLVKTPLTLLFAVVHSLGVGLILGDASLYGLFAFGSSLVGSLALADCRTRSALYRAGLWVSLACGLGAACLVAAWGGQIPFSGGALQSLRDSLSDAPLPLSSLLAWAFSGGCLGGWVSSALTLALTPPLENALDYTTDLKLLELARMDHPLLRELVLKAPGTYHHSIIVGSLVEAGADAIGANALLARVGSYYHDIGKIGLADYFVENQTVGRNPHDQTTPQLSAKIIISHVKDGRQLAETYKLGQSLIDFIEQHHGTSLVTYFYTKAKQAASQPGSTIEPDEIRQEDYRYPGPKPQSKEAAIMALADSCEAATRSLVEPTPARIEGMIRKIIMKALDETLLDEADITLREIHLVEKAFLRILLGIHHNRIQYPDQEKGLPPRPVSLIRNPNS